MKNLKRLGVLLTAVGAICLMTNIHPVKAAEDVTIADGVYIGNVNVSSMTEKARPNIAASAGLSFLSLGCLLCIMTASS